MTDKVQKIREEVKRLRNLHQMKYQQLDTNDNMSLVECGKRNLCNELLSFIDSLQEELVSGLDNGDMPIERWKQAVKAASNQRNYRSSKGLTETRDDYFVDGVQWADEHPKEEPVSDDLEEAADCYKDMVTPEDVDDYEHAYFYETYTEYQIADAFKAGAKWKEQQFEKNRLKHCNSITNEQAELEQCFIDQHLDKYNRMPTFLDAIEYGMKLKEQQLLKGTVEREVKQDAGGYPHIDATELYDYDKGIPLAKAGDKVKVVIIKED